MSIEIHIPNNSTATAVRILFLLLVLVLGCLFLYLGYLYYMLALEFVSNWKNFVNIYANQKCQSRY